MLTDLEKQIFKFIEKQQIPEEHLIEQIEKEFELEKREAKVVLNKYNELGEEVSVKKVLQRAFCELARVPNFAGDGICPACKQQIFNELTMEEASNEHITGCPICSRSYCD
jgi:hypothetical protein